MEIAFYEIEILLSLRKQLLLLFFRHSDLYFSVRVPTCGEFRVCSLIQNIN